MLTSILIHQNRSDSWHLCSFVSDTMSPTQRHWHTDTVPDTTAWPISSSNHQTIIPPQGGALPDKVLRPITGKLVESPQSFSLKKGGTLSPKHPRGVGGSGSRKVITAPLILCYKIPVKWQINHRTIGMLIKGLSYAQYLIVYCRLIEFHSGFKVALVYCSVIKLSN